MFENFFVPTKSGQKEIEAKSPATGGAFSPNFIQFLKDEI